MTFRVTEVHEREQRHNYTAEGGDVINTMESRGEPSRSRTTLAPCECLGGCRETLLETQRCGTCDREVGAAYCFFTASDTLRLGIVCHTCVPDLDEKMILTSSSIEDWHDKVHSRNSVTHGEADPEEFHIGTVETIPEEDEDCRGIIGPHVDPGTPRPGASERCRGARVSQTRSSNDGR